MAQAAANSTSPSHTPGPWTVAPAVDGHDRLTRVVAHGLTVARSDAQFGRPHHHYCDEANALLIAAAPDLLAALKEMREATAAMMRVIAMSECGDKIIAGFVRENSALGIKRGFGVRAQAAIAKAEGR